MLVKGNKEFSLSTEHETQGLQEQKFSLHCPSTFLAPEHCLYKSKEQVQVFMNIQSLASPAETAKKL